MDLSEAQFIRWVEAEQQKLAAQAGGGTAAGGGSSLLGGGATNKPEAAGGVREDPPARTAAFAGSAGSKRTAAGTEEAAAAAAATEASRKRRKTKHAEFYELHFIETGEEQIRSDGKAIPMVQCVYCSCAYNIQVHNSKKKGNKKDDDDDVGSDEDHDSHSNVPRPASMPRAYRCCSAHLNSCPLYQKALEEGMASRQLQEQYLLQHTNLPSVAAAAAALAAPVASSGGNSTSQKQGTTAKRKTTGSNPSGTGPPIKRKVPACAGAGAGSTTSNISTPMDLNRQRRVSKHFEFYKQHFVECGEDRIRSDGQARPLVQCAYCLAAYQQALRTSGPHAAAELEPTKLWRNHRDCQNHLKVCEAYATATAKGEAPLDMSVVAAAASNKKKKPPISQPAPTNSVAAAVLMHPTSILKKSSSSTMGAGPHKKRPPKVTVPAAAPTAAPAGAASIAVPSALASLEASLKAAAPSTSMTSVNNSSSNKLPPAAAPTPNISSIIGRQISPAAMSALTDGLGGPLLGATTSAPSAGAGSGSAAPLTVHKAPTVTTTAHPTLADLSPMEQQAFQSSLAEWVADVGPQIIPWIQKKSFVRVLTSIRPMVMPHIPIETSSAAAPSSSSSSLAKLGALLQQQAIRVRQEHLLDLRDYTQRQRQPAAVTAAASSGATASSTSSCSRLGLIILPPSSSAGSNKNGSSTNNYYDGANPSTDTTASRCCILDCQLHIAAGTAIYPWSSGSPCIQQRQQQNNDDATSSSSLPHPRSEHSALMIAKEIEYAWKTLPSTFTDANSSNNNEKTTSRPLFQHLNYRIVAFRKQP
jgi:hypothetical protein